LKDDKNNGVNQLLSTIAMNTGAIYLAMDDANNAKIYFTEAVKYQNNNINAHYNLAILLTTKLQDHSAALRHCIIAMKNDTQKDYKKIHLMGIIMQNLGRHEDANKYFIEAEAIAASEAASEPAAVGDSDGLTFHSLYHNLLLHLKVGDKIKNGVIVTDEEIDRNDVYMQCLSINPLIFKVPKILSENDCENIITRATPQLEKSFIMGDKYTEVSADGDGSNGDSRSADYGNSYRTSYNAWLKPDSTLVTLQQKLSKLTMIPSSYVHNKIEDLQVVNYDVGGQFKVHHDSKLFHKRLFTLLIYLNELEENSENGTWFPFVNSKKPLLSVEEAIEESMGLAGVEGNGLVITPKQGDAILFYNHNLSNNSYKLDPFAVHAGLPVTAPKWVANYWLELDDRALAAMSEGGNQL
jgi:tetratricopeptide (TPR) repeat protein